MDATIFTLKRSDKKNDLFNYGGSSEFYGLDYNTQLNKIKKGLEEFKKRNINIKIFFCSKSYL